jgi:hypothetical protein
MMMWKMTHICHLPGLVLMEKDWQVLVAAGQQGMRNRLKRKKMVEMLMMGLRVMMMRRMKKFLMLRRSTPHLHTHGNFSFPATPQPRLEGENQPDLMREKRKEHPRLVEKEPDIDYRFHRVLQQDFYESVIITKTKSMMISQWIDWTDMEGKHDAIFDELVGACRAKHLRDVMAFQKN